MRRKRLTERFPFLLPLRKFQRKIFFYLKMRLDSYTYAKEKSDRVLDYKVFAASSKMINPNSGFEIEYQVNKVHNLKLVAETMDRVIIEPGQVFSFWILARNAEKHGKYKDGLTLVNDKTIPQKGGGLCQISNLLFWLFLHTPLTIIERHPHSAETIPRQGEIPPGVDATIAEGWKDIKVKNDTDIRYQIVFEFDDESIHGSIYSDKKEDAIYQVRSENLMYSKEHDRTYRYNEIYRIKKDSINQEILGRELLLKNKTEIAYEIEENLYNRRII